MSGFSSLHTTSAFYNKQLLKILMQNLSVRGIENARNGNCNKWTMQRKFIVFVGLEMQRIICIIAGIGTCKEWKM